MSATQLHNSMQEGRHRRHKPDVDVEELTREINALSRNVEDGDDLEADSLQKDGPYKVRRVDSLSNFKVVRRLPEMELPGFGQRGEDCGTPLPHFCEEGHCRDIDRCCDRSVCSRCASNWVRKRSVAKVSQLKGLLRIMLKRKPHLQIFYHHVVISPPEGWEADSDDPLQAGFDVVGKIMSEFEMEGIAVYHPFRGAQEGKDDRGEWKERLFSNRDWEDVRGELVFSPHFHVITATSWVPGGSTTKAVESETGWLVHRIVTDGDGDGEDGGTGYSIDDDRGMVRAVTYCLSHSGIYEDSNGDMRGAVREFGKTFREDVKADYNREWAEAATREIAWQTLGIPSADMRCEEDVTEPGLVDLEARSDGAASTASTSTGAGATAADADAESEGSDDLANDGGGAGQGKTPRKCHGDLTKLHGAPHRLVDEAWCERADAPEQLLEKYLEWRTEEDLILEIEAEVGLSLAEPHIRELKDELG